MLCVRRVRAQSKVGRSRVADADEELRRKMDDLEANLRDITQRRLDFLEEAQKQQITMQVRGAVKTVIRHYIQPNVD